MAPTLFDRMFLPSEVENNQTVEDVVHTVGDGTVAAEIISVEETEGYYTDDGFIPQELTGPITPEEYERTMFDENDMLISDDDDVWYPIDEGNPVG